MKYSKHNIQQNKQTKKREKKLYYTFTQKSINLLANLVLVFATNCLACQIINFLGNI